LGGFCPAPSGGPHTPASLPTFPGVSEKTRFNSLIVNTQTKKRKMADIKWQMGVRKESGTTGDSKKRDHPSFGTKKNHL